MAGKVMPCALVYIYVENGLDAGIKIGAGQ
jgi:hypothetical protein